MTTDQPTDETDADDESEEHTCAECGEPKPPSGDLCPGCQDQLANSFRQPSPEPSRGPPHGNTTR